MAKLQNDRLIQGDCIKPVSSHFQKTPSIWSSPIPRSTLAMATTSITTAARPTTT